EKACLQGERGKGLVGEKGTLDWPRHPGQFAPVRAELERHHDAGNYTEPESHTENLEPELEDDPIGRPAGCQVKGFENRQPGCQPDCEGWKDDVKGDR